MTCVKRNKMLSKSNVGFVSVVFGKANKKIDTVRRRLYKLNENFVNIMLSLRAKQLMYCTHKAKSFGSYKGKQSAQSDDARRIQVVLIGNRW